MSENIQKYHGAVRICTCGIYNPKDGTFDIERAGLHSCNLCKGRGFVASCLKCEGKGRYREGMAGGPGSLEVTCSPCGGTGMYGVNKPTDWQDEKPAAELQEEEAVATA